ncbi:hypothetical protein CEXT_42661, partial [Caerostris extrusa]
MISCTSIQSPGDISWANTLFQKRGLDEIPIQPSFASKSPDLTRKSLHFWPCLGQQSGSEIFGHIGVNIFR